jgi:hypothetical protein
VRFRQLVLRDGVYFGDFVLREVPGADGAKATMFVGLVDGQPSQVKKNVLAQWESMDARTRDRVKGALMDPAGETVAVPVGAVLHAIPAKEEDAPMEDDLTSRSVRGLAAALEVLRRTSDAAADAETPAKEGT